MTNMQKQRITMLRGRGASYAQIAAMLGLSENTVKSFGRRRSLKPADADASISEGGPACAQCGKPMGDSKHKTRRFCSDRCRSIWWNGHQNESYHKAIYHFTCSCCGATFESYGNNHRKFCSRACYYKARTIGGHPAEVCS